MSPEDFGRRLLAECRAAFERAADVQLDQTGQRPTWTGADEWALARLHAVVAPLLRRLVDAEEAAEPGTVDAREAEAWAAFQAWSPLCPAPAGFVWERPLRAVEVKP